MGRGRSRWNAERRLKLLELCAGKDKSFQKKCPPEFGYRQTAYCGTGGKTRGAHQGKFARRERGAVDRLPIRKFECSVSHQAALREAGG